MKIAALLPILLAVGGQDSPSVLSCSGFVRSSVPLDLSGLEVALYTEHGSKRDSTDCAPTSGYFFLPVERGKYTLRVLSPQGWVWEPAELALEVDGQTDLCSQHQDIVFQFKGFAVSGSVERGGNDAAGSLADISLEALDEKTGQVLAKAVTDQAGQYSFAGLLPGSYKVVVSEESLQYFSFAKRDQRVAVAADGPTVIPPFVVVGFDVEGKVTDASGTEAVSGVTLTLIQGQPGKVLATSVSGDDGVFQFNNVSRGEYTVKIEEKKGLGFEVTSADINVKDKNVAVKHFTLASFDIYGNVELVLAQDLTVRAEQKGRVQQATVEKDGSYVLKSACICPITVTAQHDEVKFNAVAAEKPKPGFKLSPLRPEEFLVSGNVEVDDLSKAKELKVAFLQSAKVAKTVSLNSDGTFKIFLPAGSYATEVRKGDDKREEAFTAATPNINVKGPLRSLLFSLATYSISGSLNCFNPPCDDGVVLALSGPRGDRVAEVAPDGGYRMNNVPHGEYELRLEDPSRCWETSVKKLSVVKDLSKVIINQKGRALTVESSHTTALELRDGAKVQRYEVAQGRNRFCVDGDSELEVRTGDGCYKFKVTPARVNSVTDRVILEAVKYRFVGTISTPLAIKDLKLQSRTIGEGSDTGEVELKKMDDGYAFSLFLSKGEEIELEPTSQVG